MTGFDKTALILIGGIESQGSYETFHQKSRIEDWIHLINFRIHSYFKCYAILDLVLGSSNYESELTGGTRGKMIAPGLTI